MKPVRLTWQSVVNVTDSHPLVLLPVAGMFWERDEKQSVTSIFVPGFADRLTVRETPDEVLRLVNESLNDAGDGTDNSGATREVAELVDRGTRKRR